MAVLAIAVNIYQVNTSALNTPQTQGFELNRMGKQWTTHSGSTVYDNKVDTNIYQLVNTGFEYYDGTGWSRKIFYTSDTLTELQAKINA